MGGAKPLEKEKSNRAGFMESWVGTGSCYIMSPADCSKLMKYLNLLGRSCGSYV